MTDMRGYAKAQAKYDAMLPDDYFYDGPYDCEQCRATGSVECSDGNDNSWDEPCEFCDGTGKVDEDGNPWIEIEDDGERP